MSAHRAAPDEETGSRVLFVLMPWANLHTPSLGLGILQAALRREGIAADCAYLNLKLGERLGADLYQKVGDNNFLEGERLFSPYVFHSDNGRPPVQRRYWLDSLHPRLQSAMLSHEEFEHAHAQVHEYLEECLASIEWSAYDIIGFSSVFQQNLPSLALAKRVKRLYPDKAIILGGANCDGEMGPALHRQFAFLDYVVVGEADELIGPLVRAIRGLGSVADVKGVVYRNGSDAGFTGPATPVARLDSVPVPSSDDYFAALARTKLALKPQLYFESSRGCWWGQKHLCTFCGLNQLGLEYRAKSPRRVLREILTLIKRHRVLDVMASDNILPHHFLRDVLPSLRKLRERYHVRLGYEIKANLRKDQVAAMAAAGITSVQPGIESFSDHVLAMMDKGATAIQQVQTLKWLIEHGILSINYGILHGFPGELAEDYREMLATMAGLTHLVPPNYCLSVQLHRFSPYFDNPARYGIRNVRPHRLYAGIYPFDSQTVARIAYLFEFDGVPTDSALVMARSECIHFIEQWQASYKPNQLTYRRGPDFTLIHDRRGGRDVARTLDRVESRVYAFCDQAHTGQAVVAALAGSASADEVRAALRRLTEENLMLRSAKDYYLSLALPYKP